ncbi:MAG: J domain-containing protein [Cyanobacteria bacterium J06641_5]
MVGQPLPSSVECYRLLGLPDRASLDRVKAAYRQLARRYHPDCNPDDGHAHEKFVAIAAAYQQLLLLLGSDTVAAPTAPQAQVDLSPRDRELKWQSYQQLQELLSARQFVRAVSLSDSLVRRFSQDVEVRQWQAVVCHQYGRYLAQKQQYCQARRYLQKARRADPQNRSLQVEIARDLQQLQQTTPR